MPQESQAPLGASPNSQEPIFDELDAIYQNQPESLANRQFRAERVSSPTSRGLYRIAYNIAEARAGLVESHPLTHAEHQKKFTSNVTKLIFNKALPIKRPEPITESVLRTKESEIGATIFGPMGPNETRREFFYETRVGDRDSWFFHQEITNSTGKEEVTLHYEVHPTGVLRISSNPNTGNEFIQGQELDNFLSATQVYHDSVMSQIYGQDSDSSKKPA